MSEDCGQYVASKDITLGVVFPHVVVAGHLGLRRKERERVRLLQHYKDFDLCDKEIL